jgi:hypothetical protein
VRLLDGGDDGDMVEYFDILSRVRSLREERWGRRDHMLKKYLRHFKKREKVSVMCWFIFLL